MAKTREQRAKAKANGAATREATARRKAEIAANPIDWDKQIQSMRDYWAQRAREDRNARQAALRARKRANQ